MNKRQRKKQIDILSKNHLEFLILNIHLQFNAEIFDLLQNKKDAKRSSVDFLENIRSFLSYALTEDKKKYFDEQNK